MQQTKENICQFLKMGFELAQFNGKAAFWANSILQNTDF